VSPRLADILKQIVEKLSDLDERVRIIEHVHWGRAYINRAVEVYEASDIPEELKSAEPVEVAKGDGVEVYIYEVLRKGISNVVAGLILAIVIGVAMLAFINWARIGVVERVPTRLLGPCPAYVTAVYDSGFYNVYVAYPRGKVEEVLVVTEPGDVYSCPRDFKKECCSDEKYGAFYSARVRYMPVAYICRGETYRVTVYPYAAGFAAPWEQRLFTAVIRTTYNSSPCGTKTCCYYKDVGYEL